MNAASCVDPSEAMEDLSMFPNKRKTVIFK